VPCAGEPCACILHGRLLAGALDGGGVGVFTRGVDITMMMDDE
jgi:hypothetical protein